MDWHELHRLLKVAFPVDVRAENALHEMQFGYVERPTHRSRGYDQQRFEVCNHRYTALRDNSHGCAVLNDCKYGVGVEREQHRADAAACGGLPGDGQRPGRAALPLRLHGVGGRV